MSGLLGSKKRKAGSEPESGSDNRKAEAGPPPAGNNRLLAGYLAHEFLTRGTLLGRRFDSARPESGPVRNERKPVEETYADVARLLKTEGAHIPGIVNPTQLGKWLQM